MNKKIILSSMFLVLMNNISVAEVLKKDVVVKKEEKVIIKPVTEPLGVCKSRKDMNASETSELNLAVTINNLEILNKLLFVDCLNPNSPYVAKEVGFENKRFPIFNVSSLEAFSLLLKAGTNINVENKKGKSFLNYFFSYEHAYYRPSVFAEATRFAYLNELKKYKYKYLKDVDILIHDFNVLNKNYNSYQSLVKYIMDSKKEVSEKPIVKITSEKNKEESLTAYHYLAYNGFDELFEYAMNKEILFNPNIKTLNGQPLLVSTINHSCVLDKKGLEGTYKIFNSLIRMPKTNLNESVPINFHKAKVNYKDLLSNYKNTGNVKVFQAMVKSIEENKKDFKYNKDVYKPNPKLLFEQSLKTGLCVGLDRPSSEVEPLF